MSYSIPTEFDEAIEASDLGRAQAASITGIIVWEGVAYSLLQQVMDRRENELLYEDWRSHDGRILRIFND